MDNLFTGTVDNIAHLHDPRFAFVRHDVTNHISVDGHSTTCSTSRARRRPIDYLELPIQTLKVGALGTHKALGLAKARNARFLLASTSEVYGDPLVHPQREDYWGNVNPVGPRGVYDEAKRFAEAMTMAYHRVHRRRHAHRPHLQHLRPPHAPDRRPRGPDVHPPGAGRAPLTVFGDGSQTRSFCYVSDLVEGIWRLMHAPVNDPGQPGESARDDHPRVRQADPRALRLAEPDRVRAAARGRSQGAPARHRPRAAAARLGAPGRRGRGAQADDRLVPPTGGAR